MFQATLQDIQTDLFQGLKRDTQALVTPFIEGGKDVVRGLPGVAPALDASRNGKDLVTNIKDGWKEWKDGKKRAKKRSKGKVYCRHSRNYRNYRRTGRTRN